MNRATLLALLTLALSACPKPDDTGIEEGDADAFTFGADGCDGLDGNYLNVYVETIMHGSLLDA